MASKVITAAGGIVWRKAGGNRIEILLVHRPGYDDWTFPKGKADPGEPLPVTAVREIAEETGYRVRLGHPLPAVTYRVRGGLKQVAYWICRTIDDSTDFQPSREVDKIRWFAPREASKKLTYDHDRDLLERFEDLVSAGRHKSRVLVVLRHAAATPRSEFSGDDLDRPLSAAGHDRAKQLVGLLSTFGIRRVVSSPAARCVQTVDPFVDATGELLELDVRLVEGSSASQVARGVTAARSTKRPVLVCSHRPTLPRVYAALGVKGPALEPGHFVVVHHRKGKVLATEIV